MDRREIGRMQLIFTHIYRENAWGDSESRSGPGSTRARAADFTGDLIDLLKRLDTRVLLDAACGDFHWARPVADAVEHYIGLDVVPDLIDHHLRENAAAGRTFVCGDLTVDVLPKADVIVCRDCLVHLSFDDMGRAVRNFQRSGSRFLLTTTFLGRGPNEDIETGWWRPLDMEAPPFRWPPPLAAVDERCTHTGGIYRNKRLGLWALADI
jgi:SAM-dependent methyltransferase